MDKKESVFKFLNHGIDKIDFTINSNYRYENPLEVTCSFTKNVKRHPEKQEVKVTLDAVVFDRAEKNNYPFYLFISIFGIFGVESTLSEEDFEKYVKISAIATLFPYVRANITTITSLAGLPPLRLPLFNMVAMFEKEESKEE